MAKLIEAISAYGPRLDLNKTAQMAQVADYIASRTGVNKSEISMVLQELNEAIVFFGKLGTPIKLPDVGTFTPSVNRDGKFKIGLRADTSLKNALNAVGAYQGRMKNKENIGKSNAEFKVMWDTEHPTNLLDL